MLRISTLAEVVATAGSAVLLLAGTRKLGAPNALSETIRQLGLPARYSLWAVVGLGTAEVSTSLGLVLWRSWVVSISVTILAILFAGSGIVAMVRSLDLECNCLGVGTSQLGSHQLWALFLWAPVVLLPAIDQYYVASQELRILSFLIVVLAVLAVKLRHLLPFMWEAHSLRLEQGLS